MIYIIINDSHKIGDYYTSPTIMFISTDKNNAIEYFNKNCANIPVSDTYIYKYKILEYPDNWERFSKSPEIIMSIDNL